MKQVNIQDVLNKIDETIDLYDLNEKQEYKLRLLAEELVAMAKQIMTNTEAVFVIRKEPGAFTLCYHAKARLSKEEKDELLTMSSQKENAKTKTLKGKAKAFADYLFSTPVDMNLGVGIHNTNTSSGYDIQWSMSHFTNAVSKEQWDQYEKSIIMSYADDISIGILGDDVELSVKMYL